MATHAIIETYLAVDRSDRQAALAEAVRQGNLAVYEEGIRDPAKRGMGSTCVAASLVGPDLVVAHAGDCRAYVVGGDHITRLTDDHSWVGEQVRAGLIREEQAMTSVYRSVITRALGLGSDVEPDVNHAVLLAGETLLLCSDGLWDMIDDVTIASIIRESRDLDTAARSLIYLANGRGGTDNITVALVRY